MAAPAVGSNGNGLIGFICGDYASAVAGCPAARRWEEVGRGGPMRGETELT